MRQKPLLWFGSLSLLLAGCIAGRTPIPSTSWSMGLQPLSGPNGSDVVQVDVALIERPFGDAYINQELWTLVDDQVTGLEKKTRLDDNGFRVGQVVGLLPPDFLTLLTSKRSCATPRQHLRHAGTAFPVDLGPDIPACGFRVEEGGEWQEKSLVQANCKLVILPELASDGRVRLRFTPQINHGETRLAPRPNAECSQWELKQVQPTLLFHDLSWEITLAANEYLVIGARFDKPQSLGYQCFVRRDEAPPAQRLLVVRPRRLAPGQTRDLMPAVDDETPRDPSNSIAYQAATSTAASKAD